MKKTQKEEQENTVYTASVMRLLPLTHSDGFGAFLLALVLAVSLQVGCWYTVLSELTATVSDALLLPLLSLLGGGCYLLCCRRHIPLPVVLALAAACAAASFFTRGMPTVMVLTGAAATSLLAGWGIAGGRAVIGAAAAAVPVIWQLVVGGNPDRWYLGLLILCWTACFVVNCLPQRRTTEETEQTNSRDGRQRLHTAVSGRKRRTSDFPLWFLLIVLIVLLCYLFLFTAAGFQSSQSLSSLRSAISNSPQTVRQLLQGGSREHGGAGSAAQSAADRFDWLKFLLLVLKYLLIMLAVVIAAAAVLYELLMHRWQRRRIAAYGSDYSNRTAFSMYEYMRELMRFDNCPIDNDPTVSLPAALEKYPSGEMIGFDEIVAQITRIRYGGADERVDPVVHRAMAQYCTMLRNRIYESQEKKGRFWMRFVCCYV